MLSESENASSAWSVEKAQLLRDVAELKESQASSVPLIEALQSECASIRTAKDDVEVRAQELEDRNATVEAEMATQATQFEQKISYLREQLIAVSDTEEFKARILSLESTCQEQCAKILILGSDLEQAASDLLRKEEDLEFAREEIKAYESSVSSLKEELATKYEAVIKLKEEEILQTEQARVMLLKQNEEREEQIQSLRLELQDLTTSRKEITESVDELLSENTRLAKELRETTEEFESLRVATQLREKPEATDCGLRDRLRDLEQEHEMLCSHNINTLRDNEQLRETTTTLSADNEELRLRTLDTLKQNEQLREAFALIQRECDELRAYAQNLTIENQQLRENPIPNTTMIELNTLRQMCEELEKQNTLRETSSLQQRECEELRASNQQKDIDDQGEAVIRELQLLRQATGELERQNEELRTSAESLSIENQLLKETSASTGITAQSLLCDVERQREVLARHQARESELTVALESLTSENEQLKNRLVGVEDVLLQEKETYAKEVEEGKILKEQLALLKQMEGSEPRDKSDTQKEVTRLQKDNLHLRAEISALQERQINELTHSKAEVAKWKEETLRTKQALSLQEEEAKVNREQAEKLSVKLDQLSAKAKSLEQERAGTLPLSFVLTHSPLKAKYR
jgi:hypothetical protein